VKSFQKIDTILRNLQEYCCCQALVAYACDPRQRSGDPDSKQVWTNSSLDPTSKIPSQVLMAHACNPSYLGGRDQEDVVKVSLGK
jgi:hypothetical protein